MGRNMIENTKPANMMRWGAGADFKVLAKQVKRRGRPLGTKVKIDDPRTPFEALMMLLDINQKEWGDLLDTSLGAISCINRGNACASVPLAKRMVEEARIRGIAVTLDELYQHVLPWGYTIIDGELRKEGVERS